MITSSVHLILSKFETHITNIRYKIKVSDTISGADLFSKHSTNVSLTGFILLQKRGTKKVTACQTTSFAMEYQVQTLLKAMVGLLLILSTVMSSPIQIQTSSGFQPILSSSNNNKDYKSNNFAGPSRGPGETASKTNPNFVMNFQQLTRNGAEIVNVRPSRRTILSTLMAPFMSMREGAMNMLSASLQGCQNGNASMWCRFWSMFMNNK